MIMKWSGSLETQEEAKVKQFKSEGCLLAELLLLRGGQSLFYQDFSLLNKAHSHYGGQSALFKVHWFKN